MKNQKSLLKIVFRIAKFSPKADNSKTAKIDGSVEKK
jgi:hypothetical protein